MFLPKKFLDNSGRKALFPDRFPIAPDRKVFAEIACQTIPAVKRYFRIGFQSLRIVKVFAEIVRQTIPAVKRYSRLISNRSGS